MTLGLLVALTIIAGLNQFGSFVEGMDNMDTPTTVGEENVATTGKQIVLTNSATQKVDAAKQKVSDLKENADKARDAVMKAVEPQRLAAGVQSAFSRILTSAAETLTELAERSEKVLEYKTGEITSPGTLTCKDCEAEMHMTKTTRIPPCPKCHKTVFRKSY